MSSNAEKTQFIWFGSPQILAKINKISLRVGGVNEFPLDEFGVILDSKLTMKNHVDSVVRSCFYQLRQLRSIRRSLTLDAAHTLVHVFIHSRVDYCNAILVGVSDGFIRKLQSVLHAAARLVTGFRWNEHITPTLRDTLHWLPVRHRITYNIAKMAFRCVRSACPTYFTYEKILTGSDYFNKQLNTVLACAFVDDGALLAPDAQSPRAKARSARAEAPRA